MNAHDTTRMVKVGFKLERDEDDYPPADWEWMWAIRVGDSTFKIDNIPFFAKGIARGDLVRANQTDTGLVFVELVEASGHSTIRVVIFRGDRNDEQLRFSVEDIRKSLQAMGCASELSHITGLIAVDVPPETSYQPIAEFLSQKERDGVLGYEEAALSSDHVL